MAGVTCTRLASSISVWAWPSCSRWRLAFIHSPDKKRNAKLKFVAAARHPSTNGRLQLQPRHGLFHSPQSLRPPALRKRFIASATAADADGTDATELSNTSVGFADKYPVLITGFFFFMWYFLNVIFNILNKQIYNYFPYPYFVSVIHLFVGVVYCCVCWAIGLPKRAVFDRVLYVGMTRDLFGGLLTWSAVVDLVLLAAWFEDDVLGSRGGRTPPGKTKRGRPLRGT